MRRNRLRRLLSALMAAVLTFSLLPATALAAYSPPDKYNQFAQANILNQDGSQSGLKYTVYNRTASGPNGEIINDFQLVVQPIDSGTTAGYTYAVPDGYDWPDGYEDNVLLIYIEDGVQGIGDNVFQGFRNLEDLHLATTVESIGDYAFAGNSRLDPTEVLDLSNVTDLGEGAFQNCSQLGPEITLNPDWTEIPARAFQNCGLTSVDLPDGLTSIGDYAFAGNSFSAMRGQEFVLPDTLQTIGDGAFELPDNSSGGFTSLVIPQEVTSIGAHAFYGHRNLSQVDVRTEKLTHVGDAAFGTEPDNAYATTKEVVEADGTERTVAAGADFLLPESVYDTYMEQYFTDRTCYLGEVSPMQLVQRTEPTCDVNGVYRYEYTWGGVTQEFIRVIPALGHDEGEPTHIAATCDTPGYQRYVCNRCERVRDEVISKEPVLGHHYVVTAISDNSQVSAGNSVTITYTCKNWNENPDQNHHPDSETATQTVTIPGKTLSATTSDTLADLTSQLPAVTGDVAGGLSWAEENTTELLEEGEKGYAIRFTPSSSQMYDSEDQLSITVNVDRTPLYFRNFTMNDTISYVNSEEPKPVTIGSNLQVPGVTDSEPALTIEDFTIKYVDEDGTERDFPPDNSEVNVSKAFSVRAYFAGEYDSALYRMPTEEEATGLASDYTLNREEGYIEHAYVVSLNTININASFLNPTYTGQPQYTLNLAGFPTGATVQWRLQGESAWQEGEAVRGSDGSIVAYHVGQVTNAGPYEVEVRVTCATFVAFERTYPVTMAPQPVSAPYANSGSLMYQPGTTSGEGVMLQGVLNVNPGEDCPYEINGTYQSSTVGQNTFTATLRDPRNYCWSGAATGTDPIVISWSITPHLLQKPTLQANSFTYRGEAIEAVTFTSSSGNITPRYDDNGTATAVYTRGEAAAVSVYTVTNARQQNAGTYSAVVSLTDPVNYAWAPSASGGTPDSSDFTLTWQITSKQVMAPTLNIPDKTYDGQPYDETITIQAHSTGQYPSEGILTLGTNHTYYATLNAPTPMEAPVMAGTYYVEVEYTYVNNDGGTAENPNYQIIENPQRHQLVIHPIQLTLNPPTETSFDYADIGKTLPGVTVTGEMAPDEDENDYNITYDWSFTPAGAAEPTESGTGVAELPTMSGQGTYEITAHLTADNYTAEDRTYTVQVGQAQSQTIDLRTDETAETGWVQGQDGTYTMTKTLGEQASFQVTGVGTVDSGAPITYQVVAGSVRDGNDGEVTDPDSILTVDNKGVVTIHAAGTADIQVTAGTTPNIAQPSSVTYHVVVEKGTPTLTLADQTHTYTGKELAAGAYQKAQLESAGNGAPLPTGAEGLIYRFFDTRDAAGNATGEEMGIEVPSASREAPYYLRVDYAGDVNYVPAHAVAEVTIGAAGLNVASSDYSETYDGASHPLADLITSVTGVGSATVDNYTAVFLKSEKQPTDWTGAQEELSVKNVADSGIYWYRVTADNYGEAVGSIDVKITPANLTLGHNVTERTKEYDGDPDLSDKQEELTYSISAAPSGDAGKITVSDITAAYNSKDVETANTITVTWTLSAENGASLDNYTFNGSPAVEQDGSWVVTEAITEGVSITAKPITVTGVTAGEHTYDGNRDTIALSGTPSSTDILGADSGKVALQLTPGVYGTLAADETVDVGAGKQVVIPAAAVRLVPAVGGTEIDARNYTIVSVEGTTVTITRKTAELQFPGDEPDMTATFNPGGLDPSVYAVTLSGLAAGTAPEPTFNNVTDVTYTFCEDDNGTPGTPLNGVPIEAGTYHVSAALTSEAASEKFGNYTVAEISGTVTITPASGDLNVQVTSAEGLTYTGKGINPVEGVTVTGRGGIRLEEGAGQNGYTITYRLAGDTEYGTLEALTERIVDKETYQVQWLVKAGSFGTKTGSFSVIVNPATLIITSALARNTKTYDGDDELEDSQLTAPSVTGAVDEEDISVSLTSSAYNDPDVTGANPITLTYQLTGTNCDLRNYQVRIGEDGALQDISDASEVESFPVEEQAEGTITPATVTVTPTEGQSKTYGQGDPDLTYAFSDPTNLLTGEHFTGALSRAEGNDAGTYVITKGSLSAGDNYTITVTEEVFTINPYELSVSIGGAPSGYYGNNPDLSGVELKATYGTPQYTDTLDGLLEAGEITLTVMDGETPVTAAADVESYTITGADNSGNYDITFTRGTYQVQPRPISITVEDKTAPYGAEQEQLTYQVTTTAGGEPIVNGDLDDGRLTITLSTLAGPEQDVGPYEITAVVGGTNPGNYEITNTPGIYTITAAELKAEFTDPIVNTTVGGSVSNPLQLTNGSTGGAISGTLPGVTITYQSSDASVAEVDSTTGAVMVKTEGNITITANITTAETGCNYTADNLSVSYQLNVSQAGGSISVSVTPAYGLTYTGDWQDLISYTVNRPDSDLVTVTFQVRALESEDQAQLTSGGIPQGRNAGAYQVTWTASAPGYQEESGSITVEIEKASPTDGFVFSSDSAQGVTVAYNASETTQNLSGQVSLDVESLYTQEGGTYQIRSYNTAVAYVQNNNLAAVEILQTGQAEIQASFAGTDNFAAAAPSFTLTVLPADTGITAVYPPEVHITYDGEPHGSCNITAYGLTDYEVRYWSEADQDYTLTESPAITDVKDSPLEIRFQIRAFGFDEENWATGTQDIYIVAKSLQSQDITVDGIASQYTWTGSPIDGDDMRITLHDNGKLLTENVDYTVEFSNNRDVGTATVTIRGRGNYTGTVTRPFQIVSVSEQFLSAGLSEYFGYYDPVGTSTKVTVRHGSTAVTDGVTVSVTSGPSGAQVSGNTVTFHTPGIYTIHVEVSGTHTGAFDLHYTLLPQPSQDGLQLTVDGTATRIFTYGDSPTAEERTMTVQIQDAATGSWTDLKPEYYTLTYTYTGFDGTTRSGDYCIGDPLANVPEAGLYEVTAEATNGYSGTGHFVFLVLQQQLSEADFIVSGSFSYAGGAEVGPVEADISGTYWTDGGSVSLIAGDAFTLADCLNNTDAGEAQAVLQAIGNNFTGIALAEFTIAGIDLNLEGFTVEAIPDQEYRGGDPVEPAVTVLAPDGVTVLDPENYTVTYENNRNVGEAAAIVTGRGGYSGTIRAPFNIIPTSGQTYDLTLTVGQTAWEYDGTPHADSITVTYAGQTLTIGTDCTLTISKDGGVAVPYSTAEEAIASMVNVGTYTVTAVSKDDPALTDTVTVTVRPAASGVTVTVTPSVMNGGGTAQLQVRVTPETVAVSGGQLTVTRNGSAYGTVTLSAAGGGLYTGSFTAPNADATYVFTVVTVADAIHASATASAILTVNSSGGTGGDGGDSGDSGQTYIIEASAGVGGSISPDGRVRVSSGSDRTFRITPDDGYAIASVVVDGRGVGHMSSYTFENVQEDHTIEVTFRRATELGDPEATGVANWLNTVDHGNFLNGYSNGTFQPDANMTRAQAAQMFYNLLLDKDVPSTASYSDVAADAWCAEAVRVMSALGIVTGYADGTFRPNEPITRAQFAVIAMRFTDVTAPVGQSFSDVPSTAWYYDEVMGAAGFGWLSGYSDGTFRPNHPITRAEVAVITNRMLGRSADEAYINSHLLGIQQFTDLGLPHWAFYDIMEAANSHDYRKESGVEYWQSI